MSASEDKLSLGLGTLSLGLGALLLGQFALLEGLLALLVGLGTGVFSTLARYRFLRPCRLGALAFGLGALVFGLCAFALRLQFALERGVAAAGRRQRQHHKNAEQGSVG
jgi:hypothetical protein